MKLFVALLIGAGLVSTSSVCAKPREQKLVKPVVVDNFCNMYGVGYHRVAGTDVCIKVSGYVSTTLGFSGGGPMPGKPGH
jgi:hypothetical protein